MQFDIKKYNKLMSKISKNVYFRNLKTELKNKLVDIDYILKTEFCLWRYQISILEDTLKVYRVINSIKKNKNYVRTEHDLNKYIDFKSLETTFKTKLEFLYLNKRNYIYKYKIVKITEQETIQNDYKNK